MRHTEQLAISYLIASYCTRWRRSFKGTVAPDYTRSVKSGMVGQALMGIKTTDGKQNFKTYLHFVKFKLRSPSGILLSVLALHAIRGFRKQFALKGI